MVAKMKAVVFAEPGRIVLAEKPIPDVGPLDALVRVTTTTICGTDIHILKGEYPVARGLTIGHEPVGIIEKLGSAVSGYREGQRVIAGAITPAGYSNASLCGDHAQDGAGTPHGRKPMGGWKFGNTIDGCQAEFVLVPDAMANLSPVPDGLSDEDVLMCPDILSTGFMLPTDTRENVQHDPPCDEHARGEYDKHRPISHRRLRKYEKDEERTGGGEGSCRRQSTVDDEHRHEMQYEGDVQRH